ncbi:MAG: SRPBCC family protein [Pseudomonadota bacterium]
MIKIMGIIVALLVGVYALGFVLPDQQTVERSVVIDAPQAEVFSYVGDFNAWEAWSPWADIDPTMQTSITGSGVGQIMAWQSEDPKVGKGSQEIIEHLPPSRMESALDLGDMGLAQVSFILSPQGADQTKVSWVMNTNMREGMPFAMKPIATYMGFFLDGMVGPDYEKGLAQLKAVAEA